MLGKLTLPGLNLLPASFLQEEVLKSIKLAKSTQQFQIIVPNDVISESNDNNQRLTTTQTLRGTGDQIIEEVRIISAKEEQINRFSSVIPKNINISLGGLT
jgi:H2-forming N5,N10-methylenetetrahydromethanopterin dehydrogenase-like enzyme